ncbi:MAG: hypothetical protein BAJALOKI1v1_1850009 [Promethearchaeota archaeon]|nr:MAG: hypothetical protein BAJALOKI1v1_1850009 [Candidatus Lokiarchaeota archaeon]
MPSIEVMYKDLTFDKRVQTFCINPQFRCPNYGHSWACPPEAPYMENNLLRYSKFFLIYAKFNLAAYVEKQKRKHPKRSRKQIRNRFYTKSLLRDELEQEVIHFLKEYSESYDQCFILWDGHCRICEQKGYTGCAYDQNSPCRFPEKMRYSMEAVGIHVTNMVKNLNLPIEWPPQNFSYRFALICLR